MTRLLMALAAAALLAGPARALEVKIAPADFLALNPVNPNRGYSDLIVHALGVRASEACRLTSVKVELLVGGHARLTEDLPIESLVADTRELAGQPVAEAIGAQLLNARGPAGTFGAPTVLAASPGLKPGEALVSVRRHYSVGFTPDQARVSATCGHASAQALVAVKPYRSPISYRFPLAGTWLMESVPSGVDSHHRLNPSTEFASDFFRIDAEGAMFKGDRMDAATWYGWGPAGRWRPQTAWWSA